MFNLALPATISLFAGEINIASSITITGPGFSQLTISSLNRVFSVGPTATVSISGLTVANGADNQDLAGGAGILNSHQLSVTNCLFSGNKALGGGGAIRNNGTSLIVTNCTFNSNFTTSFGGGIFNSAGTGSLVVANSTFNGNTAGLGGGVANSQGSLLVASNCTFANNKATSSGGAIQGDISSAISLANCTISGRSGGGIFMLGLTLDVQNCIIADSTGNPDCTSVMPLALNSHNLIKDGSCSPMLSGDPKLGPVFDNGGPTPTMALLAGSPAIDAGDDSVLGNPFTLTTDQRGSGFPRKSGVHVDIGAFEVQAPVGPPIGHPLTPA